MFCHSLWKMRSPIYLSLLLLAEISLASLRNDNLVKELFSNYNKQIRPARQFGDVTNVTFYLTLLQLISVTEKSEEMTTSQYISLKWEDPRLTWNPDDYDGIKHLRLPSQLFWRPDIVLYNNIDGKYDTTVPVNALLNYSGTVEWLPPAIYKSACQIKVDYFPFDWQNCTMKFRSLAYDKSEINIISAYNKIVLDSEAYMDNGEWTVIHCPIRTNEDPNDAKYQDISLHLIIQRKPLFYIINILVPSILISSLSVCVFLLPSGSSEKITMNISVLIGLTVYFLLLTKRVPETSLAVPLIGVYLLFTMVLVFLSIACSVSVLNVYHRTLATYVMPQWIRFLFIETIPVLMRIKRPISTRQLLLAESERMKTERDRISTNLNSVRPRSTCLKKREHAVNRTCNSTTLLQRPHLGMLSCKSISESNVALHRVTDETRRPAVNRLQKNSFNYRRISGSIANFLSLGSAPSSFGSKTVTKHSRNLQHGERGVGAGVTTVCSKSFLCNGVRNSGPSMTEHFEEVPGCNSCKPLPLGEIPMASLVNAKCKPGSISRLCSLDRRERTFAIRKTNLRGRNTSAFTHSALRSSPYLYRRKVARRLQHSSDKSFEQHVPIQKSKKRRKPSDAGDEFTDSGDCGSASRRKNNSRSLHARRSRNAELYLYETKDKSTWCHKPTRMDMKGHTRIHRSYRSLCNGQSSSSGKRQPKAQTKPKRIFVERSAATSTARRSKLWPPKKSSRSEDAMERGAYEPRSSSSCSSSSDSSLDLTHLTSSENENYSSSFISTTGVLSKEALLAANAVEYMCENLQTDDRMKISTEDWNFVAVVIDRLLLWVFCIISAAGSLCFFLEAILNTPPDHPFDGGDPKWATCWEHEETARFTPGHG